ncbi:MAG: hypothetical protein COY02_01925 [Parcubacteria group bacterium CG_4_10_14_0_2_um_filter_41_6]|nr:MAG: hypothetical protein COY02_01925 [Parcubacteria group bacterium CG_4_10_14_0_2_um_filter_41_6]
MNIFSILLIIASIGIPSLPIVGHSAYLSGDSIRADRATISDAPENQSQAPVKKDVLSLGPQLSAQKAIIVDAKSGTVLFEKNTNQKHAMASIVKLMTALVFLDTNPNLEERFEMIEEDDREGDSEYIRPLESAKLRDFLMASLIGSANNATISLSRATGLPEQDFVDRMNEKARSIGMNNTEFKEPSGLNPENVSTAYDIAKLLSLAGKNETIREIAGMHRSMIQVYPSNIRRTVLTTNHLLGTIVFVSFGKTGYLDEAMYNLATSVSLLNGNEVYIVTLGSQTNEERVQDAKNLAVWAQRTYQWNN